MEKETQARNELKLIQSGRANPDWDVFKESIARVPTLQARYGLTADAIVSTIEGLR